MNSQSRVIEEDLKILEILKDCVEDKITLTCTDNEGKSLRLRIEEINQKTMGGAKTIFQKNSHQFLARCKPIQNISSEILRNQTYIFSFQNKGATYSIRGEFLNFESESDGSTFILHNKLYRHKIRRSYRLPIETMDQVKLQIENSVFMLINISLGGVGVFIRTPDLFQPDQQLTAKLLFENNAFPVIGRVQHIAPFSENGYLYGISLIYQDEKALDDIKRFIEYTRQNRKHFYKMNMMLR